MRLWDRRLTQSTHLPQKAEIAHLRQVPVVESLEGKYDDPTARRDSRIQRKDGHFLPATLVSTAIPGLPRRPPCGT